MANCRTLKDYFVTDEAKMYIIGGVQVQDIAWQLSMHAHSCPYFLQAVKYILNDKTKRFGL